MNTVQCLLTANCAEITKAEDRDDGNHEKRVAPHLLYLTFFSLRGFGTAFNKREMAIIDGNDNHHMANFTIVPDPTMELQPHFDVVRFMYSVSGWSSLALGLPLNALLIWLILHHTVTAMKMYARILLHSCYLDLLLILVGSTVQPILIADHGYRMLIQNGIFKHLPEPYGLILNSIWLQLLVAFDISTTFQCVFRYLLLTRDGQIGRATILKLIGLAIATNVCHYIVMIVGDWPNPEHVPLIEKMERVLAQETGLTNVKIASFSIGHSMAWYIHGVFMIVLLSSCYATILTCMYKVRRYINEHMGELDANKHKHRDMNFQITRALTIQNRMGKSLTLMVGLGMVQNGIWSAEWLKYRELTFERKRGGDAKDANGIYWR